MSASKTFVVRPEDTEERVLTMATGFIRELLRSGIWVSVKVGKYVKSKTPAQHRTVWMWDAEAAAQLTVMGAISGSGVKWGREDAHEYIFKRLCMPSLDRVMPGGEIVSRPMGLSDNPSVEIVSEAMEKYQKWAVEYGIELTQPEEM